MTSLERKPLNTVDASKKNKTGKQPAPEAKTDERMFVDRRKRTLLHSPCRRKNSFASGNSDATPWWLKVNYVNQHLALAPQRQSAK